LAGAAFFATGFFALVLLVAFFSDEACFPIEVLMCDQYS
jgi:hypothetical protein